MNDVFAIANYFIDKGVEENNPVNPMKLQKLVYIAHGWYLAFFDKPLIDSTIEAWRFGPVIPSLYHEIKHYGNGNIEEPISVMEGFTQKTFSFRQKTPTIDKNNSELLSFLDAIWSVYSKFTAIQLSNMTHEEGTPWHHVANNFDFQLPQNQDIDELIIKEHFKELRESRVEDVN